MATVRVKFLSDRRGGTAAQSWNSGEERVVEVVFARHVVLEARTAELAEGETWPVETAALDGGETPERSTGAVKRERGSAS